MPRLLLMDAIWEGKIQLTDKLKSYLKKKKPNSIALFASTQFLELDGLIKEIKKLGIEINITKAKRTNKPLQILGCDCYPDSFTDPILEKSDLILYIGDGMFHPKALLLAQTRNPKPIMVFDPIQNKLTEVTKKSIDKQLQKATRNLKMFLNAETIGILVTIKPGQQYLQAALKLKQKLKQQNKKTYIFIDDTINLFNLENYPFIKAWVNTACPRIGTDDIVNIQQPMINLREANNPIKALEDLE